MIENVMNFDDEKNELDAVGLAVAQIAKEFTVSAVVAEGTEEFAFKISKFRPDADVFFAVDNRASARTLQLAWGVQPVVGKLADAKAAAKAQLNLEAGDAILVVTADGVKFETLD
jgi:pyruvate kinase